MWIFSFISDFKGILFSAFVAAMMSSLSSVFNSAATLFTYDIYLKYVNKEKGIKNYI